MEYGLERLVVAANWRPLLLALKQTHSPEATAVRHLRGENQQAQANRVRN